MNTNAMRFAVLTLTGLSITNAKADQWGCEVLLCLSNPAGPTAVTQCVPPIHKLWRHLSDGHSFPTCDEARGEKGNSFVRPGFSYYDPCPPGMRDLTKGERAALGSSTRTFGARQTYAASSAVYSGIGSGDGYYPSERGGGLPKKVCVGSKLGIAWVSSDSRSSYAVSIYDRIVALPPHASPRIIDVYIDDAFYQRVRW